MGSAFQVLSRLARLGSVGFDATAAVPSGMLRDFKSIETAAWTQTAVPAASQLVPCSRHFSQGGIRALRIWIRHN